MERQIILASTSPRRRELIASLHIPFEVIPSDVDELTPEHWQPEQIVCELSERKARSVYTSVKSSRINAVIVGSDTIVVRDGIVLGKPKNIDEAAAMLRSLQGRTHTVLTGIACIDVTDGKSRVEYRSTEVTMRPLSEEEIVAYAATGEGLDKAGAYGIQGIGATIVSSINGCYFNVVGLSLSLLTEMLKDFNVKVLGNGSMKSR